MFMRKRTISSYALARGATILGKYIGADVARDILHQVEVQLQDKANYTDVIIKNEMLAPQFFERIWGVYPPQPHEFFTHEYSNSLGWTTTLVSLFVKFVIGLRALGMYRNITLLIEGRRGAGKTTYVVLSLYYTLLELGYDPVEAHNIIKENIFWYIDDFMDYVDYLASKKKWVPFIIGDDWGVHISKYYFFKGEGKRKMVMELSEAMDTIKDHLGVLIITTPYVKKLATYFRDTADYIGHAEWLVTPNMATISVIKWSSQTASKGRKARIEQPYMYIDLVPPDVWMPEDIWEQMMSIRNITFREKIKKAREILTKTEEENKEEEKEGEENGE